VKEDGVDMLSEDEREEILGVWLSAHMTSLKRDHPDFPYEQLLELGSRLQVVLLDGILKHFLCP